MEITSKVDGSLIQFQVAGRIDASTSPNLEHAVNAAIDGGGQRVIFDMSKVDYISSAGLRAILLAAKKAKAAGGGAAVFGLQAGVEEVFTVAGFGKIVPIATSDADARQKLGA
ncbi:MAG: STAS domain-containing protein [Blastocatellia bacterium]|nr:STAS domain-containing protein [Blastocatellia bacterium]